MERQRVVGLGGRVEQLVSLRWRYRAAICMREARSPRRAASSANRVAKWNGSAWSALGSGVNGMVLRWRCRAPTCMWEAVSPRRAEQRD